MKHLHFSILQYYGHREKLRVAGREEEVEKLNIEALRLAREVADQTGTLMAGNICNTSVYLPGDPESEKECEHLFKVLNWLVGKYESLTLYKIICTINSTSSQSE